mgnify:CR=1 FL=1
MSRTKLLKLPASPEQMQTKLTKIIKILKLKIYAAMKKPPKKFLNQEHFITIINLKKQGDY